MKAWKNIKFPLTNEQILDFVEYKLEKMIEKKDNI